MKTHLIILTLIHTLTAETWYNYKGEPITPNKNTSTTPPTPSKPIVHTNPTPIPVISHSPLKASRFRYQRYSPYTPYLYNPYYPTYYQYPYLDQHSHYWHNYHQNYCIPTYRPQPLINLHIKF